MADVRKWVRNRPNHRHIRKLCRLYLVFIGSSGLQRLSPLYGIGLKLVSTFVFSVMIVLIKHVGSRVPLGEVVFFRSAFALVPVIALLLWKREFGASLATQRPVGHVFRAFFGVAAMALWFGGFARLPIADALAISYAAPLITVGLAALMLGEVVSLWRWGAVVVILSPHLGDFHLIGTDTGATGAAMSLGSAAFMSLAAVQTSELTRTEKTGTIVVYFSACSSLIALLTVPFGWVMPRPDDLACLIGAGLIGGVGQILLTTSYRLANASVIAPLEYASMLWAIIFGFWFFGEVPGYTVAIGTLVVIGSGLLIVLRERNAPSRRASEAPVLDTPRLPATRAA